MKKIPAAQMCRSHFSPPYRAFDRTLKTNRKDHSSRRGLLKMVARRRSLLDYLSKARLIAIRS